MEQVFADSGINLESEEILDLIEEIEVDIRANLKVGNTSMVEALTAELLRLRQRL